MSIFLGIDLGTSSVKVLAVGDGKILNSVSRDYDVSYPKANYSEQNPLDWYDQTIEALKELLSGIDRNSVEAVSFSGQMHGLVMLDSDDNVIRPAILWNDGRSVKEVDYLNNQIGKDTLLDKTGNIAFAGFTAPKLLWVKNNETENFNKAAKIMLPKDYLAYRLSGEFTTDVSDASGTLYFDVKNRVWSDYMLELIGINESQLPKVYESNTVVGTLKPSIASELGLGENVRIVIGAGDNAASAVGTGMVKDGNCNISLGTSGTIYVESKECNYDKESAIHVFDSANGGYHYLACILSAASCQKWWIEKILKTDYNMSGLDKYLGKNTVCFLPYLMGERSPINNPEAKAVLLGMTPATTQEEMTLAILEGVAYALRQNIDIIKALGTNVEKSKVCGGGTKNKLWLKIIANVLNITLEIPKQDTGGALGAALLAAKGVLDCDEYNKLAEGFYEIDNIITPEAEMVEAYDNLYKNYLEYQKNLYK